MLPGGPAPPQLDQAELAEAAGWDGLFVWEGPYGFDAWSLPAAIAFRTRRLRLGTMLTPLPWWAEAGATWWLETRWTLPRDTEEGRRRRRERLEAGPPAYS